MFIRCSYPHSWLILHAFSCCLSRLACQFQENIHIRTQSICNILAVCLAHIFGASSRAKALLAGSGVSLLRSESNFLFYF